MALTPLPTQLLLPSHGNALRATISSSSGITMEEFPTFANCGIGPFTTEIDGDINHNNDNNKSSYSRKM